jgi:hypothetical protein
MFTEETNGTKGQHFLNIDTLVEAGAVCH